MIKRRTRLPFHAAVRVRATGSPYHGRLGSVEAWQGEVYRVSFGSRDDSLFTRAQLKRVVKTAADAPA